MKLQLKLSLLLSFLLLMSCKPKESDMIAQEIIDASITASGLDSIHKSLLEFDFREMHYKADRKDGIYSLERSFFKEDDAYRDILSNSCFERYINGKLSKITKDNAIKYSESVNSVHYFSILPYGLNDKAVIKNYLGKVSLEGKQYHKIKITFRKDGGGVDYDDEFIYWFRTSNYFLDYIAYSYHTNGGGIRFREVNGEQILKGVRFVNYNNYKPKALLKLENIDKAFENNQLEKVSEITIHNLYLSLN